MLVYSPKITSRLRFSFELIFDNILGLEINLTDDLEEFIQYNDAKISYCQEQVYDEPFFYATSILFEKEIKEQEVSVFEHESVKCFFSTNQSSIFPFDPFAASFYLVTRYEEYLPQIRDQYDRFFAKEGIAFKNDFLDKPLVNIWAQMLKKRLLESYPDLKFNDRTYKFIPTIDVDYTFAFLEKGVMRTLGSYAKSLKDLDFSDLKERTKVLLHKKQDPYDTFDYLLELHKKYELVPVYFFLVADYDVNDKNISIHSRKFRSIIKSMADYVKVGIHPSFASNYKHYKLQKELDRLSTIIKRDVTTSRQHFLKITFPDTYRRLIDLDIIEDYSLGYATDPGFRASICTPYYYYDLDIEGKTNLKLFPFCLMDATLKYYMNVKPNEAVDHFKPLIEEVKKVNGTFITIWHNDALSEHKVWIGWKGVYEELLKAAV